MQLYSPWVLLLLLLLPLVAYLKLRKKRTASVRFSSLGNIKKSAFSWRLRLRGGLVWLRVLCLVLLIIALARPRKGTVLSSVSTEGVAMEIVVDRSGSMQAEMDYKGRSVTRLEAVKGVLKDFISSGGKLKGRAGDLLGLITFARYADTVCPLIHGHNVLLEFLKKTELVKQRSEDGTAIGDAIGLAAARLKKAEEQIQRRNERLQAGADVSHGRQQEPEFKIKSKIIILLTDGQNNAGQYSPLEAAELAKKWGIKIYTIGIGSAQAFTTIQTMMGSFKMPTSQQLDERLLKSIAENTGGFYARSGSGEELLQIYRKIDELEKTRVQSFQYTEYAERFSIWAIAGLCVMCLEIIAGCTVFRKIP